MRRGEGEREEERRGEGGGERYMYEKEGERF